MPETTAKSNTLGNIVALSAVVAIAAVVGIAMDYNSGADEFSKVAKRATVPVAPSPAEPSAAAPGAATVALKKEVTQTTTEQPGATAQTLTAAVTLPPAVRQVAQAPQPAQTQVPFDPAPVGTPAAGAPANTPPPSLLSYPPAATPAPAAYPAPVTQAPAYPSPPPGSAVPVPSAAPSQPQTPFPPALVTQQPNTLLCGNCGTVENVVVQSTAGDASGLGAVIGGVAGGLLGNQVGRGSGRTIATIAGVAGGAYAGHQVERRTSSGRRFEVVVRMEDGTTRVFPYDTEPAFRAGERVRVVEGRLQYN